MDTSMIMDRLIKEFREDYDRYGEYNLLVQVPHLASLADKYHHSYLKSVADHKEDWTLCLKAHALYNSCYARQPIDSWSSKAHEVEESYYKGKSLTASKTYEEHYELRQHFKDEIEKIRRTYRSRLKAADEVGNKFPYKVSEDIDPVVVGDFVLCLSEITKGCSDSMIRIAESMMAHCVSSLSQNVSCGFEVVAIGSLARGEATPYSDLEYMILTQKEGVEVEKYFETFSMATYFIIGNLAETDLSYMSITELDGWFKDRAKSGFKIDGLEAKAGNIPTGNGSTRPKNHFINTTHKFFEMYSKVLCEIPDKAEAMKGDLTAMTHYMRLIYSSHSDLNLLRSLKESIRNLSIPENRANTSNEMMRQDIQKFDYKPDYDLMNKGFTINVKKEVFRFPSIFLLDVAIVYEVAAGDTWQMIDAIPMTKISDIFRSSLKLLLACACYCRLSAYLFYDSHNDKVSVTSSIGLNEYISNFDIPKVSQCWFVPMKVYLALFDHLVWLREELLTSGVSSALLLQYRDRELSRKELLFYSGRGTEIFEDVFDCNGLLDALAVREFLWCFPKLAIFLSTKFPKDYSFEDLRESLPTSAEHLMSIFVDVLMVCHAYQLAMKFQNVLITDASNSSPLLPAAHYRRGIVNLETYELEGAYDNFDKAFYLYSGRRLPNPSDFEAFEALFSKLAVPVEALSCLKSVGDMFWKMNEKKTSLLLYQCILEHYGTHYGAQSVNQLALNLHRDIGDLLVLSSKHDEAIYHYISAMEQAKAAYCYFPMYRLNAMISQCLLRLSHVLYAASDHIKSEEFYMAAFVIDAMSFCVLEELNMKLFGTCMPRTSDNFNLNSQCDIDETAQLVADTLSTGISKENMDQVLELSQEAVAVMSKRGPDVEVLCALKVVLIFVRKFGNKENTMLDILEQLREISIKGSNFHYACEYQEAIISITERSDDDYVDSLMTMASDYSRILNCESADQYYSLALSEYESFNSAKPLKMARFYHRVGRQYSKLVSTCFEEPAVCLDSLSVMSKQAVGLFTLAIKLHQVQSDNESDASCIACLISMGEHFETIDEQAKAQVRYNQALQIALSGDISHQLLSQILSKLDDANLLYVGLCHADSGNSTLAYHLIHRSVSRPLGTHVWNLDILATTGLEMFLRVDDKTEFHFIDAMLLLARRFYHLKSYDDAIKKLEAVQGFCTTSPKQASEVLVMVAQCYWHVGSYDMAMEAYIELFTVYSAEATDVEVEMMNDIPLDHLLSLSTRNLGINEPIAKCMLQQGKTHGTLGKWDQSITCLIQALQLLGASTTASANKVSADVSKHLGISYQNVRDPHTAEKYFQQAIQYSSHGQIDSEWYASLLETMGDHYEEWGEPIKSQQKYAETAEVYRNLNFKHPRISELCKKMDTQNLLSLAIHNEYLGNEELIDALSSHGDIQSRKGGIILANDCYNKALKLIELLPEYGQDELAKASHGAFRKERARILRNLGINHWKMNLIVMSIKYLKEALECYDSYDLEDMAEIGRVLYLLGEIARSNEPSMAKLWYERSLAMYERSKIHLCDDNVSRRITQIRTRLDQISE